MALVGFSAQMPIIDHAPSPRAIRHTLYARLYRPPIRVTSPRTHNNLLTQPKPKMLIDPHRMRRSRFQPHGYPCVASLGEIRLQDGSDGSWDWGCRIWIISVAGRVAGEEGQVPVWSELDVFDLLVWRRSGDRATRVDLRIIQVRRLHPPHTRPPAVQDRSWVFLDFGEGFPPEIWRFPEGDGGPVPGLNEDGAGLGGGGDAGLEVSLAAGVGEGRCACCAVVGGAGWGAGRDTIIVRGVYSSGAIDLRDKDSCQRCGMESRRDDRSEFLKVLWRWVDDIMNQFRV